MDTYNHFYYGQMLATQHREIAHTARQTRYYTATEQEEFDELQQRMSAVNGVVLVAIDGSNSDFSYTADNMTERPQYFFLVLTPTNHNDPHAIYTAQQRCTTIGKQLVARMLRDHWEWRDGLGQLDPDSFMLRGVGPIADNLYGSLVGFNVNSSFNFEVNPDVWNTQTDDGHA